jgi:regulatory protein
MATTAYLARLMRKGGLTKRPLNLRARGVQLLSQREHSVSELSKKLQSHARLLDAFDAACAEGVEPSYEEDNVDQRVPNFNAGKCDSAPDGFVPTGHAPDTPVVESAVDAVADVLVWLQDKGYLSDARFAQSRVDVRSARFGNLRIRQELALHQVELTTEAAQVLQSSELERALAVLQRKFPRPFRASDAARQSRFLRQRGFSSDIVRQALRASANGEFTDSEI